MKYLKCLFLDRVDKRSSVQTIIDAINNVKAGQSMFIMPEGTRSKTDEMLPFKKGSFKIAEKIDLKDTGEGYDLELFWNMYIL